MTAAAPSLATQAHPLGLSLASGCVMRAYHHLNELETLRPAWDSLLQKYQLATTFSTWEWLSCWWRAFGANNQKLLVLAAFNQENTLIGLAPFSIAEENLSGIRLRMLRMMGDGTYDSDNLDLPVQSGYEQILGRGAAPRG